jgi:GNAT superfamily N-acetyltransferase
VFSVCRLKFVFPGCPTALDLWFVLEVEWREKPDEKTIASVAEMVSAFEREVIPGEPDTPAAEVAADLFNVPPHRHVSLGVASERGEIVGTVRLVVDDAVGNQDLAEVEYLIVRPDRRRAGIGRALVRGVCERTERPRIRAYVPVAHPGGMGLAAAAGATPGIVDRQSRVRVADLDRQMLDGWVRRAQDRAQGYSLVCFDGRCPDDLLEGFALLTRVMNTAPRSAGDQDVLLTPAEVRAFHETLLPRMGWVWTACARHDATAKLVGFTQLLATGARPWLGQQWDTGVDPAHRNLGLGRWLKAANALRLIDERPEVTTIETWNAGVNAAMLAINNAMGFRPVAEWQEWTLERG